MKNLQQYSIGNIDKYFNFTCETFYENIFTTNSFAARGYNLKYKISDQSDNYVEEDFVLNIVDKLPEKRYNY